MCTLIIAFQAYADTPLLVAANRDEKLDRPATGPAHRTLFGVPLFAPKDEVAGGTWIGLNPHGVFAGITNRAGLPPNPALPSRGRLVPQALAHPTAAEAKAFFQNWDATQDNGFHLVIADRKDAFVLISDTQTARLETISPGLFIATERSFQPEAPLPPRTQLITEALTPTLGQAAPDPNTFKQLLSHRAPHPPDGTLVHIPEFQYGTRASTQIRMTDTTIHVLHAEGPPDTTAYTDHGAPYPIS